MACFVLATTYNQKPAGKYFLALANELAVRGHKVVVLVPPHEEVVSNENSNPAIVTWISKRPTGWRDALFFRRLMAKVKPDAVISTFASVNICTLIGWLYSIPNRVVWYRTISQAIDTDNRSSKLKTFFFRFRKRLIYNFATHFVANSKAAAADLQAVYKVAADKCTVLHFLADEPQVSVKTEKTNELICVGRLHPSKGQETVIRAVARLKSEFPALKAEFVGAGRERVNYENLAQDLGVADNCQFVGSVSSPQVFEKLAAASICVVPSHNEAMGWVNIEAQSVGTPVVASSVDGIKEVVVDGKTGFLVPPKDVESFAAKIELLLKNEGLRQKLAHQARLHFADKFSLKHIAKHAEFFETLVAK
jgi:glycosyltransferase involved in cell wall biosynthesis